MKTLDGISEGLTPERPHSDAACPVVSSRGPTIRSGATAARPSSCWPRGHVLPHQHPTHVPPGGSL